jgi:MYXO-CTERM domain-containing protein
MKSIVLVLLALPLSLATRPARADVIRERPMACPRGTVSYVDHLGEACLAAPPATCPTGSVPESTRAGPLCIADKPSRYGADCPGNAGRRDIALCVETVQVPEFYGSRAVSVARSACGPNKECPAGTSCEVDLRCAADLSRAPPHRSCACARPGAAGASTGAGVATLVAIALFGARRRRKP